MRTKLLACNLLLVAAWLPATTPAFGVVLHPDGEPGPSAKPDDAVVGRWGDNASCTVIDPQYVITTLHQGGVIGIGVVIGETTYRVADIFSHSTADLRTARLETMDGDPADLSYWVGIGAPHKGDQITIGGFGKGRGETLSSEHGDYGYTWDGGANDVLRWGMNVINGYSTVEASDGTHRTRVITADFDHEDDDLLGYVEHEAAVAEWDSGGGWFHETPGGQWEVIGLSRGIEHTGATWFREPDGGQADPDSMDAVRLNIYATWIDKVLNRSEWNVDSGGTWSEPANWSTSSVPGGTDEWVVFGDVITGSSEVVVGPARTVGTIRFEGGSGYTIAGAGLILAVGGGSAVIEVTGTHGAGAHTISVPVTLKDPLLLDQESGCTVTMSGSISGAGDLTKIGFGTAVLGAGNALNRGVEVRQGTLAVAAAGGLGSGPVTVHSGATLRMQTVNMTVPNDVTLLDGAVVNSVVDTEFSGAVSLPDGAAVFDAPGPMRVSGTIGGSGRLTLSGGAALVVSGTVAPGAGEGTFSVIGDVVFDDGGTLAIEIGGAAASGRFDRLDVFGSLAIDGILELALIEGFTPDVGDTFEVLTWFSRSGTFAEVTGWDAVGDLALAPVYEAGELLISAELRGDVNRDKVVDLSDVVQVIDDWQAFGDDATWISGDVNFDGIVDLMDITTIIDNWQATPPVGGLMAPGGGLAHAPEPGTLWLLALGACLRLFRSRSSQGVRRALRA